jgi:DNA-binding NarL/FixJ family response regulator
MKPIRVLLADDHTLVRAGFLALLQNMCEIEAVAEAGEGHEALQLIEKHQPDVALIDITMPGLNGLEVAARVVKEDPHVRVIMLSMHTTEEYVLRALQVGASGYLIKDAAPAELELAVEAVAGGEIYLSPAVSKHVVDDYLKRSSYAPVWGRKSGPYHQLTSRQREILQLVAEGYTSKKIAKTLHISNKTVETHRRQIMRRLNIHNLAGLVRYAIRMGLISSS